ncbi:hypothetical protein ACW5W8_12130 [Aeromonas aquatilis]
MNICLMGGAPACIARISLDILGNTVKHQPDKWTMKNLAIQAVKITAQDKTGMFA